MGSWFSDLPAALSGTPIVLLGGLSLITFFGTLILLPVLLIRIPRDYFVREGGYRFRKGVVGILFHLIKNSLGLVFLAMGVVMLFIPGQGLLTILAGLWLMDLPGKRSLEIRMVRTQAIHKGIDYIRKKAGRPSLLIPGEPPPDGSDPSGTAGSKAPDLPAGHDAPGASPLPGGDRDQEE